MTQPKREPGDDSVWDGRSMDSLRDSFAANPEPRKAPEPTFADILLEGWTADPRKSESPLESAMFTAFLKCGFNTDENITSPRLATLYHPHRINTEIGVLTVDFAAIRSVGLHSVRIAIELDGHAFHAATKQQVERDLDRNRALARKGWLVMRYPGSQVMRDPTGCALDVAGAIIENVDRLTSEGA